MGSRSPAVVVGNLPPAEFRPEAGHLLVAVEGHEFRGGDAGGAGDPGVEGASQKKQATDDPGFLTHLEDGAQQNPQRMASHIIRFAAVMPEDHGLAVVAGAEGTVMQADLVGEGAGLPAFHPGGGDRDPINGPALHRHVTADFCEAFAAEQLAGSGDVLQLGVAVVVGVFGKIGVIVHEGGADDPEGRIGGQLAQQKPEVAGIEGDIRIEVADHVVGFPGQQGQTGIEGMGLGSELALLMDRALQQGDPWVVPGITGHDVIGAIGGAIADNDPADGTHGLGKDGLDGGFDEIGFIPRRGDQGEGQRRGRGRGNGRREDFRSGWGHRVGRRLGGQGRDGLATGGAIRGTRPGRPCYGRWSSPADGTSP